MIAAFLLGGQLMSIKSILCTVCILAITLLANSTQAAIIHLEATLDGDQANAGAGSGGTGKGFAAMTYDDVTNLFSRDISWSGLTGTETVMYFHGPASPDENAGVQVNFGAYKWHQQPVKRLAHNH